jgi:signal transduction histidine kinase
VLIAFIKPSQDEKELAETKAADLWDKLSSMDHELRKASLIKVEFLNNINHEVRTPMTGITSLGQALWENYDVLPEDKRREYVRTIAKSSDRLISLMNNILDLSALTSLKISLNLSRVNLSELVKSSVNKCCDMYLENKSLNFEYDIEENLFCKCDKYHISQTIDNLVINAISYSTPGTEIIISLSSTLDGIKFSILDQGIGIPENELYDVFKPFIVSSKTKSLAGGRGIGLALCHAVVESHGGKIWAESDGKTWTRFSFVLR